MARLASIDLHGRMLVDKRPLLVRVALEADRILRGGSPHLLGRTVPCGLWQSRALDQPFVHPMMERHVELGFLLEMARVAKLGLRLNQQKLRSFAWCGEWQEMQLTSFFIWTELMAFMCCVPPAWQFMQRALISFADASLKVKILVLSPPPATWAFPGPWQPSQPCHAGPFSYSKWLQNAGNPHSW